jgi:phosphoethanolamine N-methyltransferase
VLNITGILCLPEILACIYYSQDATLEEMMLDSSAHDLCKEEEPEIISYLPNLKSKDVVELGAGIG